jgi:hypothetical protein
LKENKVVRELDLSFNYIDDGGAVAPALSLKKNSEVSPLDLSVNSGKCFETGVLNAGCFYLAGMCLWQLLQSVEWSIYLV